MARAKAYVVALGDSGYPLVYFIHQSRQVVNEARNIGVRMLSRNIDATHGPTKPMMYSSLRKEIPGFDRLITCLEAGGMVTAVRPEVLGTPDWQFECTMAPTRPYPGRLPHPGDVRFNA